MHFCCTKMDMTWFEIPLLFLIVEVLRFSGSQFTDPYVVLEPGGTFVIQNSASQLSSASTVNTIVIPGDDNLDSPGQSSIKDKFKCNGFEMKFQKPDPTIAPLTLKLTVKTSEDKPKCTIDWDDGLTDESVTIDGPTDIEHTYLEFGIYSVSMSCEVDDKGTVICPVSDTSCFTTTDFLDDIHSKFKTPLTFFSSEPMLINSYMELSSGSCTSPDINWRITAINDTVFTPFTDFVQPNTSVIRIEREILDPGEYIVNLEVTFPSLSKVHWGEDHLVLKVVHPELVTHISGGEMLQVPHGQEICIDASISTDPVFTHSSLALSPLVATWSFASLTVAPTGVALHTFLKNFPAAVLPAGATSYQIQHGTEYVLKVNTSPFLLSSYAVAMFTLTRGSRQSSSMQVIQIMNNVLPLSIECVYNCHIGRERLIYFDKLELDAKLPDDIDTSDVTYSWTIRQWYAFTSTFALSPAVTTQTGFATSSLGISSFLTQGQAFKITVTANKPGYTTSEASFVRTVNIIPYGGTCALNSVLVTSARDWLTLVCSSWYGNDDRKTSNAVLDINPILTITVRQQTVGALVEEEPILTTRSLKSHLILKVGTPNAAYSTSLFVQVADMYKNYNEISLSVTSKPAFSVNDVTPTEAGAELIRNYTEVDYRFDEQQLKDMGKSDMIISLVSAVCSNLHLVELPIWEPPVPRKLNSDGAILDLSPNGNADVGTLDEVSAAAANDTTDPATLAIQEVMLNMTGLIRVVVETDLLNGSRQGDKMLTSLITNAFTNLAAKEQFVNTEAKINLIYLSDKVGTEALEPENTTADQAAQIETTSGEIYYMFQAIVNSAVPDNLNQIRPVKDLKSGREQIDEMLSVIGSNMSLNNSLMSPAERAYLYMQMQRELRYQTDEKKDAAKDAAKMAIKLAKNIQEKLKICSTCSNEGSDKTNQLVKKNVAKEIKSQTVPTQSSYFRLDGLENAVGNGSTGAEPVSVSAYEFTQNVFMYDADGSSSYVTSNVLRLDAKTTETRVTVGFMTFQQVVPTPDPETIVPYVDEEDASEFMYHQFIYQKSTDYVCFIVLPLGAYNFTEYVVYIKFSGPATLINYDVKISLTQIDNWQHCILPEKMKGNTGVIHLAVSLKGNKKDFAYNFTLITVGCMTWEEKAAKWHSDKCSLEWHPEDEKITCYCEEITDMVFANSFFVAPNSIDFSTVFLRFSPLNQAAVLGTLSAIALIYFVAVVLLAGLDRRDTLKWGITPLRDNVINDKNYYIIKVCTGMRRGAGTRSRVAFTLTGLRGDTGTRELFDGVRTEFSTGSIMSFFMATKKHLGVLEHLYIWHDNSGEGDYESWYPNQVVVYDIEKRLTYTFVLEKWLSLETTVDAHVISIPQDVSVPFESRFFYQTRDRLSESHMWVSILYRPQISTFTRVQRASCALVYIFLTMIANAMYFNPEPEYVMPPLLQVGPIRFTSQQIFISLVCALMTTPVVMLLIFIFKRSKIKQPSTNGSCINGLKCWRTLSQFCRNLWRTKQSEEKRRREELLKSRMLSPLIPDFSGGIYLPWWFIYIAWFLVLIGTLVPAFFILLYSMEWGKQKSEEWLTTFFMSLLESMLFVDPITSGFVNHPIVVRLEKIVDTSHKEQKVHSYFTITSVDMFEVLVQVVCIALVLALLIRSNKTECNVDIDEVIENYKKLMGDEKDIVASSIKVLKSIKTDFDSFKSIPRTVSPPLKGTALANELNKHLKHVKLVTVVRDLLLNLFFMLIISTICFANRDSRSFLHYMETVNTIVEPLKMPHFNSITTPGDLYTWLNVSVFPSLFPEFDINGAPLHWSIRQFTTGYNNLRLGPPRLRQLRTKNGTCDIPYIGTVKCYGKYSIIDEEEDDYCLAWEKPPCKPADTVYSVSEDAWKFLSALEVWGFPLTGHYTTYGGGGYIANLAVSRNNSISILNELFRNLWIDRQTRAVMLEFTLYNGLTNIFIYHVFMVEFPETGGAFKSFSIYPIRVYTHLGAIGTLTLLCEVIFVIYLIILLVKICIRIYQQRCGYFKQFWQVYEIVMLSFGVAAIGIYFIRYGLTALTIKRFKEDRQLFVDFSHIVLWDQILVALLGSLVFMATLRVLEIFAASKKVSAIVKVFQDCGGDLFWYGMTFLYIFFGFCFLGMLLFGSQLYSYMSMYQCMGTLFIAMIGKSQFTEINETQPILAKVFFMFYILTVVFFILTIFLSILGASIDTVVHNDRDDKCEDLIEVLMKQVKHLFVKPTPTRKANKIKQKNNKTSDLP